jgi:hypothetical protein
MAQTPVWIQIETRPSLLEIEDRARAYSAKLPNISAFSLGSGWYVIAMGPFSEEIADAQRRDLQSRLAIPSDSFVTVRVELWDANLAKQLARRKRCRNGDASPTRRDGSHSTPHHHRTA